jgi:alanine racemase
MISERAWAEIDLSALQRNLASIRQVCGVKTDVMLVVKADAYGHGMKLVATAAQSCGIRSFGVRDSSEALALREQGIGERILVLGTVIESELEHCLDSGIEFAIHSTDRVKSLRSLVRRRASRLRRKPRVHLNVDTGMGRLGLPVGSANKVLDAVLGASNELDCVGVMTHLSRPEGIRHPFTLEQAARFEKFLDTAKARGMRFGRGDGEARVHIANSAGLFTGLAPLGDFVRPGIAAYGVLPHELRGGADLRPVMSVRAQIVFLKDVPKGTTVSYAQEWTAPVKTRVATVPLGYFDGIPWRLRGKGSVLLRGQRVPIIGRITMDYVMLDITRVPGVRVGDRVTFFGKDGDAELPVEEVARAVDTIPLELTCAIGSRLKRHPVTAPAESDLTVERRTASAALGAEA